MDIVSIHLCLCGFWELTRPNRWINELLQIYIHSDGGLLEYVKWDCKRGRDFQGLSFMIYCCDNVGGQPCPTTPRVTQWLDRVDAPSKTFKQELQTTLSNFLRLAMSYKPTFQNYGKSLAPVEFVYIGNCYINQWVFFFFC
jgi:hypothetical protein